MSTLYGFYLAMVLYPDVQRRAQTELDSVVGTDRLPCLEDREKLPYINALVKELLAMEYSRYFRSEKIISIASFI